MAGSDPHAEENKTHSDDVFEIERIRQLMELMEQHGLSAIDLRCGEQQIRLRRGGGEPAVPPALAAPAAVATPAAAPVVETGQRADDDQDIIFIKSPMVGTFYRRPNPDAEAFVQVGDTISADTTVCIIEAMKVFNEIPAEISGKVVACLVDDEEPVEFGKPLFKVDTST